VERFGRRAQLGRVRRDTSQPVTSHIFICHFTSSTVGSVAAFDLTRAISS